MCGRFHHPGFEGQPVVLQPEINRMNKVYVERYEQDHSPTPWKRLLQQLRSSVVRLTQFCRILTRVCSCTLAPLRLRVRSLALRYASQFFNNSCEFDEPSISVIDR